MPEASPVVVIAVALWMPGGVALLWKIIHSMHRRRKAGAVTEPYEGPLIGGVVSLSIAPLVYVIAGEDARWAALIPATIGTLCIGAWLSGKRHARRRGLESGMSFRERSALIILATNVLVFGNYFLNNWDASLAQALPAFLKAVGLSISVLIGAHIAIAAHSRNEDVDREADERDKMIDLFSIRNAHYVLLVGAWLVPLLALKAMPPLTVANTALAVLVASALVLHGSQVIYYRYGV